MQPEKDQFFIYTDAQLSLIKNTFAENDTLLYAIRNLFLQFPLSDAQKGLIKMSVTPEVIEALRLRMLPDLSPQLPLGQLSDLRSTLTENLKTRDVEDMAYQFAAKKLEIDYLEQQFNKLANLEEEEPIKLADMASLEEMKYDGLYMGEPVNPHKGLRTPASTFVNMTAYLFLLGYIDPSLNMIKVIAGTKNENVEEAKKRMKRDSSK